MSQAVSAFHERDPSSVTWRRLALWTCAVLVVPAAVGWFAFALADSIAGVLPEPIRISADGDYDPYLDDFVVFYSAGELAREGSAAAAYDVNAIHSQEATALGRQTVDQIPLPYFNPPPLLLPLAIVALLPLGTAATLWVATQVAFLVGALRLMHREGLVSARQNGTRVAVLAFLASMPVHEVILHGQISFLLLAGWVLFLTGAPGRRPLQQGLGLCIVAVKPHLALVGLCYLAWTRQWRALAWFGILAVAATLLTAAVLGPGAFAAWIHLLFQAVGWEDENGIWVHAMFGWNALVLSALGPGYGEIRVAVSAALALLTIALAIWRAPSLSGDQPWRLAGVLTFATLLVSPHLFAQDLVLAAVPVLFAVSRCVGRVRVAWAGLALVGWFVTLFHFPLLHPGSGEQGVNLVTIWLLAGLLISAFEPRRLHGAFASPSLVAGDPGRQTRFAGLVASVVVAVVLFSLLRGFVEVRYAQAISYSYTASRGPTYRIAAPLVAHDGLSAPIP